MTTGAAGSSVEPQEGRGRLARSTFTEAPPRSTDPGSPPFVKSFSSHGLPQSYSTDSRKSPSGGAQNGLFPNGSPAGWSSKTAT